MRISTLLGAGLATLVAGAATADITGAYVYEYSVTASDFDGSAVTVNIQDLYLSSDNGADVALNVFNYSASDTAADSYFQSFTGTGWQPTNLGGPFDTPALRLADSFVTIGGFAQDTLLPEQAPGTGTGSALDPDFGGNDTGHPDENAGWYNGSPPSYAGATGQVADGTGGFDTGVLIGRFAYQGDFTIVDSTLWVTWNQGLGTPGQQSPFIVTPAPGALALLGLAPFARRRRRH